MVDYLHEDSHTIIEAAIAPSVARLRPNYHSSCRTSSLYHTFLRSRSRFSTVSPGLSACVGSVNSEVGTLGLVSCCSSVRLNITYSNVGTRVTRQEGDGTHQVLRTSHLTNGNERSPLLLKVWVVVENLLGATTLLAFAQSSSLSVLTAQ